MTIAPTFDVYVSPYKEIPASVPGWNSARPATWPATTATLIRVGDEAILVDALMTTAEGHALGSWAAERTRHLKTVYVTHAHADHFFGAASLLPNFPTAELVATSHVAQDAKEQTQPAYLEVWEGFFPGQVASSPRLPRVCTDVDLRLGGFQAHVVDVGRSDVLHSTALHVPDLDLAIVGDVAYNGIHMWMAGSDHEDRVAWLAALDQIERLGARTVIAGHRDPEAPDDDAQRILDDSRRYVDDFDVAAAQAACASDLVSEVMSRHGDRGNPYSLWNAAASLFPEPAHRS